MKKLIPLLLIIMAATACNKEKEYMNDLQGTWGIYKYTLNYGDKTSLFKGHTITFTNDGNYYEMDTIPDSTRTSGTYNFQNDDRELVLTDSLTKQINDTVWISQLRKRTYTIYNLSSVHLQLFTDSSEIYLDKTK